MKKILFALVALTSALVITGFSGQEDSLTGAWQMKNGTTESVLICKDGYFTHTLFDLMNKKFIHSNGGTYRIGNGQLVCKIEFNTSDTGSIGTEQVIDYSISGNQLSVSGEDNVKRVFTRIDDGTGELAGNWRITGRMNNGGIQPMRRTARKTLKLLSGTRFQWMAINPETKEFFGTGGGTYTFKDGKYTENIEFFSRDSSRVGASLSFEGSVANNIWTHKGLNSRGEPLHEEWSRENH